MENKNGDLEQRLRRLEVKVERLESQIREGSTTHEINDANKPGQQEVRFRERRHESTGRNWLPDADSLGENWLNWLGIGLLLLGVVFLFKYSIDQGWLVPEVRSMFGVAIGIGLVLSGFLTRKNTVLRNILLGGGIATFYITGFATFQLYSFISSGFVWVFMVGVTLFTLVLSLQQHESILSVLGIVGGLGTPFMLHTGSGSVSLLVLYTCLILAASGGIYMAKGWKSLLWSTAAGGWLVLLVGWITGVSNVPSPALSVRWSLQLGALFLAGIGWILPVVREFLTCRDPGRWGDPERDTLPDPFVAHANVQVLSVLMPVTLLFYSYGIWTLGTEAWGGIALAGALVVGFSYLPLQKGGFKKLSLVHGFSALVLITAALFLLLEGEILLIALALEALSLRVISSQTGDKSISLASHLLFIFIGIWIADRLLDSSMANVALFNLDALTELFIIGIGGITVPQYLADREKNVTLIYRLVAHFALLGWFLKELAVLQDGQAFVTVAWGIYALLLLFLGFWRSSSRIRLLGMGTIFLVVGKLFLIDLTQINTLLRILLFIGFGILFLLMSYLLHKKWGSFFSDSNNELDS